MFNAAGPSSREEGFWELGKLEGDLRILWCACFCPEAEVTCPNPFLQFLRYRGVPGSSPFPRTPHLLVSPVPWGAMSKSCKWVWYCSRSKKTSMETVWSRLNWS